MRPFSYLRRVSTAAPQGLGSPERFRTRSRRLAQWASVLLVFGCAEVGVHWGLRLLAASRPLPAGALQARVEGVDSLAARAPRLFGDAPVRQARGPARYRLFGVIGGGEQAGAALIGVDGKPAQAYAVGAEIAPGVRLVSTGFGRAQIEQDGRRTELESLPGQGGDAAVPGPQSRAPAAVSIEQHVRQMGAEQGERRRAPE